MLRGPPPRSTRFAIVRSTDSASTAGPALSPVIPIRRQALQSHWVLSTISQLMDVEIQQQLKTMGEAPVIKSAILSTIRSGTRAYLQHAPFSLGKMAVANVYYKHANWRPHRQIVKTKFGALMDLTIPDAVSTAIYITGQWEPCITEHIRTHLRRGDTFIDVGANVGYYSLLASSIVGTTGSVVAIEASPAIFARLKRNLDLNCCDNVRAMNVAASDVKGELSVFLAGSENLGHTTTVASLAVKEGLQQEARIPADSLQNLVGSDALFNARFVKIDVEGAEISVLSPLFESLHKFSDSTEWLLEFSPDFSAGGQTDLDRIYDAFIKAGYKAYGIPNKYSAEFQIFPPPCSLTQLTDTPRSLCDVIMSRAEIR